VGPGLLPGPARAADQLRDLLFRACRAVIDIEAPVRPHDVQRPWVPTVPGDD
jgi:hypothetical protein